VFKWGWHWVGTLLIEGDVPGIGTILKARRMISVGVSMEPPYSVYTALSPKKSKEFENIGPHISSCNPLPS